MLWGPRWVRRYAHPRSDPPGTLTAMRSFLQLGVTSKSRSLANPVGSKCQDPRLEKCTPLTTEMMDVGVFWSFTLNELMNLVFPSERCWTIFCFISESRGQKKCWKPGCKLLGYTPISSTGVMFMSCKVSKGWPHDCVRWKHQHFQMGHNGTPATLMFFFWLGGFITESATKAQKTKLGVFSKPFF